MVRSIGFGFISLLGVFILESFFDFPFQFPPVVQTHPGGAAARGAGGVDHLANLLHAPSPAALALGRVLAVVALALGFHNRIHFTKYLRVIASSCGSARPCGNARFG